MSGAKGEGGEGRVRDETTLVFPPLTKVVSYLSPLNSYPHLKKTQRERKKERKIVDFHSVGGRRGKIC